MIGRALLRGASMIIVVRKVFSHEDDEKFQVAKRTWTMIIKWLSLVDCEQKKRP